MATPPPRPGTPRPPELLPGLRWRRLFPSEERQLAALRRWLASLLPQCPARDEVALVANELASNAIRHSASGRGGQLAVEVTWRGNVVRVAVADSGGPAEPHVIDDPASEHGWGLLLVRGLSARTGVCGDHRGRLIWPDVLCEDPGTETATDRPDGYEAAIRDGQAGLARRFTGVPAWFGRATLEWWALAGPAGLVTAPTAQELAGLLYRLLGTPTLQQADATQAHQDAAEAHAARRGVATNDVLGTSHRTPGGCPGHARVSAGRPRSAIVRVLAPAMVPSPSRS